MKVQFIAGLIVATLSCYGQDANRNTETEKIRQTTKAWIQLLTSDSLEKTLSFWTDDAIIMTPGQPEIIGKKAIRDMVGGSRKIPGFSITWDLPEEADIQVSSGGDMAYMSTRNKISMKDPSGKTIVQNNKGITIWRKQADGTWKDAVDIWNAEPLQTR